MTALAIRDDQTEWTPQQAAVLKAANIRPQSKEQASLFLAYCQATQLDPVSRQIYLLNGQPVASIDGMRLVAQRTGEYRGQIGPQWCGTDGQWMDVWVADGPPSACRVGVLRAGFDEPVWGIAMWREFGSDKGTWRKMPAHMLAKVAESHSLRKAFPNDLSGLYSADEMGQRGTTPPPIPPTPTPEPVANVADETETETTVIDDLTGEVIEAELLEPGDE